jgi:magnesium-transporting ATPase (P-type)
MMLTGDHMLTSIATFKELKITTKTFVSIESSEKGLIGKDEEDKEIPQDQWDQFELAINGNSLQNLIKNQPQLLSNLTVISRVSPK